MPFDPHRLRAYPRHISGGRSRLELKRHKGAVGGIDVDCIKVVIVPPNKHRSVGQRMQAYRLVPGKAGADRHLVDHQPKAVHMAHPGVPAPCVHCADAALWALHFIESCCPKAAVRTGAKRPGIVVHGTAEGVLPEDICGAVYVQQPEVRGIVHGRPLLHVPVGGARVREEVEAAAAVPYRIHFRKPALYVAAAEAATPQLLSLRVKPRHQNIAVAMVSRRIVIAGKGDAYHVAAAVGGRKHLADVFAVIAAQDAGPQRVAKAVQPQHPYVGEKLGAMVHGHVSVCTVGLASDKKAAVRSDSGSNEPFICAPAVALLPYGVAVPVQFEGVIPVAVRIPHQERIAVREGEQIEGGAFIIVAVGDTALSNLRGVGCVVAYHDAAATLKRNTVPY